MTSKFVFCVFFIPGSDDDYGCSFVYICTNYNVVRHIVTWSTQNWSTYYTVALQISSNVHGTNHYLLIKSPRKKACCNAWSTYQVRT